MENHKTKKMERIILDSLIKKISLEKEKGLFLNLNKKKFQLLIGKFIFLLYLGIYILSIKLKIVISRREKTLISGRNYLNKCLEGIMIKNKTYKKYNNPKISIIIPVYNSQNSITSAIKSVQNQNMSEIEIILVNDFSQDNSSKIINQIQQKDPRIKVINKARNMGILHSRCIGVLLSKGKYILNLDHDDMFFDEDVFDTLYESAEKGKYDIISFMEVEGNNYYVNIDNMKDGICTHHPNNLIIQQPKLSYYTLFKNDQYSLVDIQIWGKLFNNKVYKKAVNLLGKKRYSIFNIINEDIITLYVICSISKTYKYLRKYGLFHLVDNPTASKIAPQDHCLKMDIFFSDIIFDLSKNNNKKYSAIIIIRLKEMGYFNLTNKKIKAYLISVIKKIMNCIYIEDKYKNIIRKEYEEFGLLN